MCVTAIVVGVNHLRSKSTEKSFLSREAREWVTEEEQGTKVSLAENRSLTETIQDQGLERRSRRKEPGTQSILKWPRGH